MEEIQSGIQIFQNKPNCITNEMHKYPEQGAKENC